MERFFFAAAPGHIGAFCEPAAGCLRRPDCRHRLQNRAHSLDCDPSHLSALIPRLKHKPIENNAADYVVQLTGCRNRPRRTQTPNIVHALARWSVRYGIAISSFSSADKLFRSSAPGCKTLRRLGSFIA